MLGTGPSVGVAARGPMVSATAQKDCVCPCRRITGVMELEAILWNG